MGKQAFARTAELAGLEICALTGRLTQGQGRAGRKHFSIRQEAIAPPAPGALLPFWAGKSESCYHQY